MFTINKKKKSLNIHLLLVSELDKLKANNIVLIDLKDKSPLADFMIIAGGNSSRHVNSMAQKSVEFLKDNKAEEFGKLMTESHISLSRHYGVSTDNLNKLVDLSNSFGALGSKLTGAGFGGAIVTLVKKELVEELKKYILDGYPNAKFI